jgi:hypothetical protein
MYFGRLYPSYIKYGKIVFLKVDNLYLGIESGIWNTLGQTMKLY